MKKFLVLIIGLLFLGEARAQMTALEGMMIVNEASSELDRLRSNAQVDFNAQLFNLLVNAEAMVSRIESDVDHWLNKTDAILTDQQARLINNLQVTTNDLVEKIEKATSDELTKLSIDAQESISETIIGTKRARVVRQNFPTLINNDDNVNVLLEFKGTYLNNKNNVLIIDGNSIPPTSKGQRFLQYRIPKSRLVDSLEDTNTEQFKNVELQLYSKKKFLKKSKPLPRESYSIRVVPEVLSTVKVNYQVRYDSVIIREHQGMSGLVGCRSGRWNNCVSSSNLNIPVPKNVDVMGQKVDFYIDTQKIDKGLDKIVPLIVGSPGAYQCNGDTRITSATHSGQNSVAVSIYIQSHTGSGSKKECYMTFGAKFPIYGRVTGIVETHSLAIDSLFANIDLPMKISDKSEQIKFTAFENVELTTYAGKKLVLTPNRNQVGSIRANFLSDTRQVIFSSSEDFK
jgi:hypothetical protein